MIKFQIYTGQFSTVQEVELGTVPVGFDLRSSPVTVDNFSALRFRGEDRSLLQVDFTCALISSTVDSLSVVLKILFYSCS